MHRPERTHLDKNSLLMIGVPRHFLKVSLDDYDTYKDSGLKNVKNFVKDYLENIYDKLEDNEGIFFYGSNGVGKSMLSSIIVKEAYRKRVTCCRVTFSNYISKYTEIWGVKNADEKETAEENFYSTYKGVELLVLEEIGKEIDSKIAKPILEDLLRYREEKGLVTIFCSNIDLKSISDIYGPSVVSLIKGLCVPVKIVSSDKRSEK